MRYHGDFDWGGLRIAGALRRRVPWEPWRYTASDYRAVVGAGVGLVRGWSRLSGPAAESPWDEGLAVALAEHGVRVEEEAVLPDLLSDLRSPTKR
ncbi:DUF2399 domain-containing protein [Streptomyces sp. WMMC897]|nr:DUF2399 domain-containing protein [Streptomyces sp. WMMC897]MCZ7416349.1 DUF2399 domain-containing protein [Streptomyces sp. WMMC897]